MMDGKEEKLEPDEYTALINMGCSVLFEAIAV